MVTEIGGTVGDIESLPFLEAIRQFPVDVGRRRCMFIHLTLVPYISHAGELKTKPTQHSVNELRRIGIAPDMVVCRSESELSHDIRRKIALFASLPVEAVVSACDVPDIYQVPLVFNAEGVDDYILSEHFGLDAPPPDLSGWEAITRRAERGRAAPCGSRSSASTSSSRTPTCRSPRRSGTPAVHHGCKVEIDWVDSETVGDPEVAARLESADGILIPGGFGGRGLEGKIRAAQIARERKIPYLGICLGMHVAVSEFARHVAGMEGANSTEMDLETPFPVIDLLPEQKEIADMGGTMRLGADPVKLHDGTRIRELYDEPVVYERHRHRYEVNNHLRRRLEAAGLVCSGTSPDERLVEAIELQPGRSPVLRRLPVPPRVQVAARAPRAAVPRVRRRRAELTPRAWPRTRRRTASAPRPTHATAPCERAAHAERPVRRATDAERERLARHVRDAVPDREPVGARAGLRQLGVGELRRIGLEVEEDDAGPAAGSDAGNLLARIPGAGTDSIAAVRPPGHRAAGRTGRAGARRRRLGERQRRRSSAPTTRPRSR